MQELLIGYENNKSLIKKKREKEKKIRSKKKEKDQKATVRILEAIRKLSNTRITSLFCENYRGKPNQTSGTNCEDTSHTLHMLTIKLMVNMATSVSL